MVRVRGRYAAASLACLAVLAVACSATIEGSGGEASGPQPARVPASAGALAAAPSSMPERPPYDPMPAMWAGARFGRHPRIVDSQHARVFSEEVREEKAAQLAALEARHGARFNVAPASADAPTGPDVFAAPAPNFTVNTYAPLVGAPATWGASWTVESASDQIFFGVQSGSGAQGSNIGIDNTNGAVKSGCTGAACSGNNFFSLVNLYDASTGPTLQWSAYVSGGISSGVALSWYGDRVYALSDDGHLYCFAATTGATCASWTVPALTIASGGAITPWVDNTTNAVYVANGSKGLYRINYTTGAVQWGGTPLTYTSHAASKAAPVELDNVIYLGDGAGYLWRIVDPTTGTTDAKNATKPTSLSSAQAVATNCAAGTAQAIDGSVAVDLTSKLVFLPNYACMFSFPHFTGTGTWAVAGSGWTASAPNQTHQTWPTLDGTYVYWVIADKPTSSTPVSAVWKAPYALTSVSGSNLVNASSGQPGAGVKSSPVVWNSLLYVGDQSGYVEEFGCASSKSSTTAFCAETTQVAGSINSPIVFDDATGNIEYGFTTSGGGGGLSQWPLWETGTASTYTWGCPAGYVPCDDQACGAGDHKTACVPFAECVASTSSCQTVASLTSTAIKCASASENGAVALSCPTGQVILSILGASYGTPQSAGNTCSSGSPTNLPTFAESSTCHAADTLGKVNSLCLVNGAQSCTFVANNATFGDPCVGTGKNMTVWYACGAQKTTLPSACSRMNLTPYGGATPTSNDPCKTSTGACTGTCSTSWGDCNANLAYDGCETSLTSDVGNCGACGYSCPSHVLNANGVACSASACTYTGACNTGYGDCNANKADGCETGLFNTPTHCGTCATNCTTSVQNATGIGCGSSACTFTCNPGYGNCDANASNGCETNLDSTTTCGTACGATVNCTTLAHVVSASAACSAGVCVNTCAAGWLDCDGNPANGCEASETSTTSCGTACGALTNCSTSEKNVNAISCTSNACSYASCKTNFADCDANKNNGCETSLASTTSCGTGCGATVDCTATEQHVTSATCTGGACGYGACATSYGNCDTDATNGCETDLTTTANCGACATNCTTNVAQASGVACVSSACTYTGACNTGYADCDANKANGCEKNLSTDVANCGACGRACTGRANSSGGACSAGACVLACNTGFADCNGDPTDGCETSLTTITNCGSCGASCGAVVSGGTTAPACVSGVCQYLTPGETYSVTVSSLHTTPTITAIGGGGGGPTRFATASGAGGGALCYGTSSGLTAGHTLTIVVGAGGAARTAGSASTVKDGTTTIASAGAGDTGQTWDATSTVSQPGGRGGTGTAAAGIACHDGGAGGDLYSGYRTGSQGDNVHGGGGGAGGYAGGGGTGGRGGFCASSGLYDASAGVAGSGGAGAGGGGGASAFFHNAGGRYYGGAGGGVGLTPTNTTATTPGALYCDATSGSTTAVNGSGGMGAGGGGATSSLGTSASTGGTSAAGGSYGGGGGTDQAGGNGAVTIQW